MLVEIMVMIEELREAIEDLTAERDALVVDRDAWKARCLGHTPAASTVSSVQPMPDPYAEAKRLREESIDMFLTTGDGRHIPMHRNPDGSYSGRVKAGEYVQGTTFSTAGTITVQPGSDIRP